MTTPRLRTVDKTHGPYPLGKFPTEFALRVGKEIIYKFATSDERNVEGAEWERIFAFAVGAQWKPSNVGLDDVIKGNCAWGAKSVKHAHPFKAKSVRLISGRNSPNYSFGESDLANDPGKIGRMVLEIWNGRVDSLRQKFTHLRTVVLIKSTRHNEYVVFEKETSPYDPDDFEWKRNRQKNLEAIDRHTERHCFTWQPHGSQFTIVEDVPCSRLCFRIVVPRKIDPEPVLREIGFKKSWVTIVKPQEK